MAIKITKKDELIKIDNVIVTIIGHPGIGKTTLGLTTENAVLFDFDKGIQRSALRTDSIQLNTWSDIANLTAEDLQSYNTIVIDTVGRLLEILSLDLIKNNSKLGRATGELTLQGYGALSVAFKSWINKIKSFGKDIVLIGHAKESQKGDDTIVRIDSMGASKDEIFKISDLMGYVEIEQGKRLLNFNPTEKSHGKNCAGFDILEIPHVNTDDKFLASIIEKTKQHMNKLSELQLIKLKEIENFKMIVLNTHDVDEINALLLHDINVKYPECKNLIHARAKKLNLIADKVNKCYVIANDVKESVNEE